MYQQVKLLFEELHDSIEGDLSRIDMGPEGAKAVADDLANNHTLQILHLGRNDIGPVGTRCIAASLKLNNTLHTLNLGNNLLGDEGAKELAEGLKENKALHTLDLYGNNIGDDGARAIATILHKMRVVYLGCNNIGDEGVKDLAKNLLNNASLQKLYLVWNKVSFEGAQAIAAALKRNSTLRSLNLANNSIGDDGVKEMVSALKQNKTLHTLGLAWNNIGLNGFKAVSDLLACNSTLHTLYLLLNNAGDEGAKALAAGLKHNRGLHILGLASNNIGPQGTKAIAESLKHNSGLQRLQFSGNHIGDEGGRALLDGLTHNGTLCKLELSGCKIPESIMKQIDDLILQNELSSQNPLHPVSPPTKSMNDAIANGAPAHVMTSSATLVPEVQVVKNASFSGCSVDSDDADDPHAPPVMIDSLLQDIPMMSLAESLLTLEDYTYHVWEDGEWKYKQVNLSSLLEDAERCLVFGRCKAKERLHLGTPDQIAAIRLYTMPTMYQLINSALKDHRHIDSQMQAVGPYLHLLLSALRSLPEEYHYVGMVYRGEWGIPTSYAGKYALGQRFIHWGFTSTTLDSDVLQNFCSQSGDRVAFKLQLETPGYLTAEFSEVPDEGEVLLEPVSCFTVTRTVDFDQLSGDLQNAGFFAPGLRMVEATQEPTHSRP